VFLSASAFSASRRQLAVNIQLVEFDAETQRTLRRRERERERERDILERNEVYEV